MGHVVAAAVARLESPLRTPFVTALRRTTALASVAVRVTDSDGYQGFGEGPQVWRVTGESMASIEACALGPLGDVLLGWDVSRPALELAAALRSAVVGNAGARFACELAVTDLAARRAGAPLHRFLGGEASSVRSDLTISADASDATVRSQLAQGFGTVKVKVGLDPADTDRVLRIHDAAEGRVRIRVDANQGWDVATTLSASRRWLAAGVDLEFIEQPLPHWDLEGHAYLRAMQPVPIMLDESVFTMRDLERAFAAGAADLVNVKLAKCGGLHAGRAIAESARRAGLGVMFGSMMESRVGTAAVAALAAAVTPEQTHDLDAAWWVAGEASPAYRDGRFVLSDEPGLSADVSALAQLDWSTRS